jgi:aconitase A
MPHNSFDTFKVFQAGPGKTGQLYSLPALADTFPTVKRLPVSIRLVLESVLRNVDGKKVTEEHVKELASWSPKGARTERDPLPRSPACCCRTSPACRSSRTSPPCAASAARMKRNPR